MMRPVTNGKVPVSTPALDQPMPFSTLETATARPKAPVSAAVPVSRPLREITEGSAGQLATSQPSSAATLRTRSMSSSMNFWNAAPVR